MNIKFGIGFFVAIGVATLTLVTLGPRTADAADPCQRQSFKTELIETACAKGGQIAAKDAMKQFAKDHQVKCNQCHAKLAPAYELKPDGLKQFHDLGGK